MITYSSEGVKFPNIKKRETSNWIHRVVDSYGKKVGEILHRHYHLRLFGRQGA